MTFYISPAKCLRPASRLSACLRRRISKYVLRAAKRLGEIRHGTRVNIICDGCKRALSGHVRYISPQAEFSPPVIYSTRRREKLLFMAEAVPVKRMRPSLKQDSPLTLSSLLMNENCIEVCKLNKRFGENHVVKDFSLTVRKGRFTVFLDRTAAEKRRRFV